MFNLKTATSLAALIAALTLSSAANAQQFAFFSPQAPVQAAPQQDAQFDEQLGTEDAQLDPRLQKQIVDYSTRENAGTIVIDTANTYLYLVMGNGKALRYGIGVGREGFTWAGTQQVARKAEWPDWHPPAEMIQRQPYLPRFTAGGPGNPLGARAMYLGSTVYRIHGTNDATTIGKNVSSGCIRLTNEDVIDLYSRVQVGAKVVVLPQTHEARTNTRVPQNIAISNEAASSYASADPAPAERTWQRIR